MDEKESGRQTSMMSSGIKKMVAAAQATNEALGEAKRGEGHKQEKAKQSKAYRRVCVPLKWHTVR